MHAFIDGLGHGIVFKTKSGTQVVTMIKFNGQTCWFQSEGSVERTEVFAGIQTGCFYTRKDFEKLMTISRKAKFAEKISERRREGRIEPMYPRLLSRGYREPEPVVRTEAVRSRLGQLSNPVGGLCG